MIEEPEYKPVCCGQRAKWVCISVNLHYFYCEVCKKEVQSVVHGFSSPSIYDWTLLTGEK